MNKNEGWKSVETFDEKKARLIWSVINLRSDIYYLF